jgi:hypothetical protein
MGDKCCLACGTDLPEPLYWAGSLRCQDCRDAEAPLDPELCADLETLEAA